MREAGSAGANRAEPEVERDDPVGRRAYERVQGGRVDECLDCDGGLSGCAGGRADAGEVVAGGRRSAGQDLEQAISGACQLPCAVARSNDAEVGCRAAGRSSRPGWIAGRDRDHCDSGPRPKNRHIEHVCQVGHPRVRRVRSDGRPAACRRRTGRPAPRGSRVGGRSRRALPDHRERPTREGAGEVGIAPSGAVALDTLRQPREVDARQEQSAGAGRH